MVIPGDNLPLHLKRFVCTGSTMKDDSTSHRRLFSPLGSKVLATVSRHMLEVTNDGSRFWYDAGSVVEETLVVSEFVGYCWC